MRKIKILTLMTYICDECGAPTNLPTYTKAIITVSGPKLLQICHICYQKALKKAQFKTCIDCGAKHQNISSVCNSCIVKRRKAARQRTVWTVPYVRTYPGQVIPVYDDLDGEEMPNAILAYEALQVDADGVPTEGAYRLKLEGNFKTHIEPLVKFIKAAIPSSDRTYDPKTYEWFYHEKYAPIMDQALKGSRFTVQYSVTKEAFVELKKQQAAYAKQAEQSFQTKQYPVDEDVKKFTLLLSEVKTIDDWIGIDIVKNWTRDTAISFYKKAIRFFHPDLHPERAAKAAELNEVWARLKEGYYIK